MEKNLKLSNEYIKIHNYALAYKRGDVENAKVLINYFDTFIFNYVSFIEHGTYSIKNYSIRQFISLYNNDIRKVINMYKYNTKVKLSIHETVSKINFMLSDYEREDIYNECVCALLEMASRYNDTKPSFHVYVKKSFHFYLKYSLDSFTRNSKITPSIHKYELEKFNRILKEYEVYEDTLHKVDKDIKLNLSKIKVIDDYTVYDDNHLYNFNWANGITCSKIFKNLNCFERYLIVESYMNKKSDSEISKECGLVRETINRKRRNAINKIKEEAIKAKKLK